MITLEDQQRLSQIRSKLEQFRAITDVSTWETEFLLRLLESKDREIRELRGRVK